jgi:hypothetical protein
MTLHGHVVLIVEPDAASFVSKFQEAIERDRGESIAVRTRQPRSRAARDFSSRHL